MKSETRGGVDSLPDSVKNFLAYGYVKKRSGDWVAIAKRLSEFVAIVPDVPTSEIDNTIRFSFAEKDTSNPLIYVRRYSEPDFRAYLRNDDSGFEIVKHRTVKIRGRHIDRALYLLRTSAP